MADLATITPNGSSPTMTAATAGGDTITPGPRTVLIAANSGGAALRIVVDDPTNVAPPGAVAFDPDLTMSVPAGAVRFISRVINAERFARASDGKAVLTYPDGVTGLTLAPITVS